MTSNEIYPILVNQFIRDRYSEADELAILRQRDSKPDEFNEYNAYCEECKAKAKQELNMESEEQL